MKYSFSRILTGFFILFCICGQAFAQEISVSVPSRVSVGENFRLAFTINSHQVENFRVGEIPAELEVLAGPYTSQQSSFQMVNGHTSSSSSITYTYTLYASSRGTYTISPAHAVVNGKNVKSRSVKITVSGGNRSANGEPKMHEEQQEGQMRSSSSKITGKDLFIKVTANKQRVTEQEPILLTYKVYTLVDLSQLQGKMPDLTGFHVQEVPLPQQKSFHVEKVNGRNYRVVTWSQYVMYPQMTGKLTIPGITFKGIVVQQNRSVDPFEAFFNGGSGYVEVHKDIKAPSLTVQVTPLPRKPTNFSGGVGKFNISASVDREEVKAGEPVTFRVVVGGTGNLKLIKQPELNVPKDFDKYDAKVTDKTRLTASGVEGNMVYDFLVVPRNQGAYDIPAVEFVYYDVTTRKYQTIKTRGFHIKVGKGDGKSGSYVDYGQKDDDIRGLKSGEANTVDIDNPFFGSVAYWVTLLTLLLAFVILLIVFRKRAMEIADVVKMKSKRASKVATKRLRRANQLMLKNQKDEFYEEILQALWGYVSDKLNIPVVQLSRDNIREKLQEQHVDSETIGSFISALDDCEMMRYAPGDSKGNMNKTFIAAMTAIMNIEEVMKQSKSKVKMNAKGLVVLFVLTCLPVSTMAIRKVDADSAYLKGNYQQAIKDYQELLHKNISPELYYNLGNAYYRSEDITRAIIAYQRALKLSPGDRDIRFNLQLASSKTIDKITPANQIFLKAWYLSLINLTGPDNWARIAVFSLIVSLLLALLYLLGQSINVRKTGFYGACLFLLLFIVSNFCAYQQREHFENSKGAIVVAPAVNVKQTPATDSKDAFVIHEGTYLNILDKSMKDWRQVELFDGREGWIRTDEIEEI